MRWALIFAGVVLGFLPAPLLAGIVVLKNGDVIVAEIDLKASDKRSLALRGPMAHHGLRSSRLGEGTLSILRSEVRYFDAKARRLGAAYFEKFPVEKFPLAPRFLKDAPTPPIPEALDPELDLETLKEKIGRLDPKPVEHPALTVCKPRGWRVRAVSSKEAQGPLLVFRPDEAEGARRIQVSVVSWPASSAEEQRARYLEELGKRGPESAEEVVDKARETKKDGRSALVLTAASRSKGRRVFARRHIVFLGDRLVFISGYAEAADLKAARELTDLVAATLKIKPAEKPR